MSLLAVHKIKRPVFSIVNWLQFLQVIAKFFIFCNLCLYFFSVFRGITNIRNNWVSYLPVFSSYLKLSHNIVFCYCLNSPFHIISVWIMLNFKCFSAVYKTDGLHEPFIFLLSLQIELLFFETFRYLFWLFKR